MLNNLSITLVESDDDVLEVSLLKQADDTECTGQPLSEEDALEKVLKIRDDGHDFFIAKVGGIPVGYAVGIAIGRKYYSRGLYVSPKQRNQGIGTELKEAQIDFATSQGFLEIWSDTSRKNRPAFRMLEKTGFEDTRENDTVYFGKLELQH